MTGHVRLTFTASAKNAAALQRISKTAQRPKSELLCEALDLFLEDNRRMVAHIKAGIADAKAGRVIEHERISAWLKSWGTENELPPPRVRRRTTKRRRR